MRKPQRFWAGSITDAADGCRWARETVTNPKGVQSEAGLLQLAVPQLRATEKRFHPKLVERLGNRLGHGVEAKGTFFCCAHCARGAGVTTVANHA